jgi:outer membrane protein OmpA-like peptidoglycan-associated protein
MSKSISPSRFQDPDLLARHGRNLVLFGTAVCGALAFSDIAQAQDFSNLQNAAKVEKIDTLAPDFKSPGAVDLRSTRTYLPDRGVVMIEEADGTKKEEPYVILPILFKLDSDELLNAQSQLNLKKLAEFLKQPSLREARFCIEGHTSTEGTHEHNMGLSKRRSDRVFALLIDQFGVTPYHLRRQGFGPDAPEVKPELTEQDRQRNRRVLVVREQ